MWTFLNVGFFVIGDFYRECVGEFVIFIGPSFHEDSIFVDVIGLGDSGEDGFRHVDQGSESFFGRQGFEIVLEFGEVMGDQVGEVDSDLPIEFVDPGGFLLHGDKCILMLGVTLDDFGSEDIFPLF